MLLIHAPAHPRVEYTLRLFFERLIPVPFRITQDESTFRAHEGPRLCYGSDPVGGSGVFVRSAPLSQERGIRAQSPSPSPRGDTLVLFPVDDSRSALGFDVFSAAFYLVSRYEEYVHGQRDEHGRPLPRNSVLFQEGFLTRPVVNHYGALLRRLLEGYYPRHEWPPLPFEAISTVDVDVAYAYRGRSLRQTAAAAARDVFTADRGRLQARLAVLRGIEHDPYDTYAWLDEVHRQHGIPLVYFILMSRHGRKDRNLDPRGAAIASLVRQLSQHADVGVHPSYRSGTDPPALSREIRHLERHTRQPVARSRQHFLRVDLPATYRALIASGIEEDFSMGYAPEPGFRAGIAAPFPFYDLQGEAPTSLVIRPLAYMDGTLREYRGMTPDQAKATVETLVENVRGTGGTFISLWHNHTVSDRGEWAGWRDVFLHSLQCVSPEPNRTGG